MAMPASFSSILLLLGIALCTGLGGCDSTSEEVPDAFFVSFVKEVTLNQTGSQLACSGNPEYTVGHPTYKATFLPNRFAAPYTGRIKKANGTFGAEAELANLETESDGKLTYKLGVGSIVVFFTCDAAAATAERQRPLQYMDTIGHQGIEVTAHAN